MTFPRREIAPGRIRAANGSIFLNVGWERCCAAFRTEGVRAYSKARIPTRLGIAENFKACLCGALLARHCLTVSSSIPLNRREVRGISDRRAGPRESEILGSVFSGGGEMGELMRHLDWGQTPLGPVATWSPALRMMARFLLANRFPLLLWWGPQFCQLYNDAYRPILGNKHPQFVGRPVSECWNEIWHILEPLIRTPFEGGPSTWMEDIPLELNRHGFLEETHFTIAYSPVPDDTVGSGIGGVLATVHEISEKVVGERRTMALRDLGAGILEERTAEEACARAADVLANYPKDIAFALLYLLDPERKVARLGASAGVDRDDEDLAPTCIDVTQDDGIWPFRRVLAEDRMHLSRELRQKCSSLPAECELASR